MIQDVGQMTSQTNNSLTQATIGNSQMGKDEFLKLLTYQLKAQNPLKPYDNQEFASQLAQFSQLEQLTGIRSLLEEQMNSNSLYSQSLSNTAIPGMLGKYAKVSSDTFQYEGDSKSTLGFAVPYDAVSGEMNIYDSSGNLVRTMKLEQSNLSSGEQKIEWDGTDNSGNSLSAGKYSFEVKLNNSNGASANAEVYTYGKISSVRFKSDGTYLLVNSSEVPFNNIVEIMNEN